MNTQEAIEAAAKRWEDHAYPTNSHGDISAWDEYWMPIQYADDQQLLANVAIADRQQRERDQQPPTRAMFERLGAKKSGGDWLTLSWMQWRLGWNIPVMFGSQDDEIALDTIAKLRAACLLLGIETDGVL